MTKKQALVVISFGTTCPTARTAIESIEHYLAANCPIMTVSEPLPPAW